MAPPSTSRNSKKTGLVLAGIVLAALSSALIAMTLVQANDSYKEFGYRMITPLETEALLKQQPDVVVLAALDPSKTYILHCKSGGRSDRSLPIMRANNITNVHHLEAGFDGWKAAGLPISRP